MNEMETNQTVLVVDDDARLRGLLRDFLQKEQWQVEEAADGVEALTAIAAKRPAIVILDLMMPRLDGIEVCRRVRQTSQVSIIMLTANYWDPKSGLTIISSSPFPCANSLPA